MHPRGVLGQVYNPEQSYHVAGAGISGLFIAYQLFKKKQLLQVHEASSRSGGLLETHHTAYGLAEGAANGFVNSYLFEELNEELGLEAIAAGYGGKARYIFRNNQLRKFPLSFSEFTSTIATALKSYQYIQNTTVKDFGKNYLGEALTNNLLSPALSGIYGARADELGFEAIFPELALQLPNKKRLLAAIFAARPAAKITKPEAKGSHSYLKGMRTLTDALQWKLNTFIKTADLYTLSPEQATIITCPAYESALLLEGSRSSALLKQIRYIPLCSCTIFMKKELLSRLKSGFGCLLPENENSNLLGILFNHDIFEARVTDPSLASLTCIFRGEKWLEKDETAIYQMLEKELKQLLGLKGTWEKAVLNRYEKALPLYSPLLPDLLKQLDQQLLVEYPNVSLFGNYTGHISLRKLLEASHTWII